MKKILFICICLIISAASSVVSAQYDAKACRTVASASSACNKGTEPFRTFIAKFRKSEKFRKARSRFSDEMSEWSLKYFMGWQMRFKTFKLNERCDKSYATWYDVSANKVCYSCGNDWGDCEIDGGSGADVHFERIDGKWYCTYCFAAG